MWRLYQFPLCPFSRAVRIALAEKGVDCELVEAYPWDKDEALSRLNPAIQTPTLEKDGLVLSDSQAIIEYFDETTDAPSLLGADAVARAEARRLAQWFGQRFYAAVTAPLLTERMYKRLVTRTPPDGIAIRSANRAAELQLQYIDDLLDLNPWLAGPTFSVADIQAAAQISVADYLGGIDWTGHAAAKTWYSAFKSRPAFRPLLTDRMQGIRPAPDYDRLDF